MRCARCHQDNPEGARFCNQCGATLAPAAEPELRRLTVLFCDLVGSVELANRLDPEEWHALLAAYQAAAGQAIRRHQGHVAQHLGDGLVAYFGYPVAHEDDALRAVRAALDLVREAGAIAVPNSGGHLSLRVGVHTGAAVMGPVGVGGDVLALGDTPHIAARLQALAHAGTVVLSPAARSLVEHKVRWADLGEHALKGLPGVMRVHQALALRGESEEAEAGRSPFVGRVRELASLVEAWSASQPSGR
ncbi:MAG TPA: adenylate/guanylate cyclase domain-containing protein, partial [Ramlibacter sp.]|nr:adenylate/guanylate cyclase domain-containing protein [Ramlibacter sp.]